MWDHWCCCNLWVWSLTVHDNTPKLFLLSMIPSLTCSVRENMWMCTQSRRILTLLILVIARCMLNNTRLCWPPLVKYIKMSISFAYQRILKAYLGPKDGLGSVALGICYLLEHKLVTRWGKLNLKWPCIFKLGLHLDTHVHTHSERELHWEV